MTAEWGHHRIFAPQAYRGMRDRALVPIVHTEAMDLARLFPICWTRTPDGPVLSVLRALTEDGSGIPAAGRRAFLPRAMQAYPVVVPSTPEAMADRIQVDRAIAEDPSDVGAPLMMGNGKVSRALATRTRTALATGRALPGTRDLTDGLDQVGLLEPWPLHFDLGGGQSVAIDHLLVLSRSRLDDPGLYRLIARHGVDAAVFIAAHRISLFKVSGLLRAAQAAAAGQPARPARAA